MKSTKIKRFYTLFVLYATAIVLCCVMSASQSLFTATAVKDRSHTTSYINAPVYVA